MYRLRVNSGGNGGYRQLWVWRASVTREQEQGGQRWSTAVEWKEGRQSPVRVVVDSSSKEEESRRLVCSCCVFAGAGKIEGRRWWRCSIGREEKKN